MQNVTHIILLLMAGICQGVYASQDSLLTVWQNTGNSDSLRAAAFKEYIWSEFLYSEPEVAFNLAEELLVFGRDNNYLTAEILAYKTQGVSWYLRGDYPRALNCYNLCIKLCEQIGDLTGISASLNNIGLIYNNQGDYPRALNYYIQSLEIDEEIGDQKGIAQSLNNIGIIYNNLGDYPMALDYHTQSLSIKELIGDEKGVAASLNNIGIIYQDQGDYHKALEYHSRSLKIKQEINDRMGIAPSLHNIGIVYLNIGEYDKALEYFNSSIKIKEAIGDQKGIAQSLHYTGLVYGKLRNFTKAIDRCQRSYNLALVVGVLELQKSACRCLYDNYKAIGDEIRALQFHELLNSIKDSLHTEETAKKLQQMEFKKAMLRDSIEKAEEARLVTEAHRREVQKKNRTKNLYLSGGVILIIVTLSLWRVLHFVRRSRKIIASEKEKSEKLLLNILPRDIAEELKQTGVAKPRSYRQVSIVFTDFVDFTTISAQMSPEELVTEINTCYRAFDRIIEMKGIEKIKTIGDAYMAVDGFRVDSGYAARNIVLAALEIIEFTQQRQQQRTASGKPAFTIRAGIHTGDVIAGIVGDKKFQFDIWGDAVNTASRMETCSETGRVNISQATYELLRYDPQFVFESRGEISAKGKGPMKMWFVKLSSE